MATSGFRPAVTGNSRVFLIDGRAGPTHRPLYQSNMKAGGLSQSFGDIEDIEIPSPDEYGKFLKVGEIRDQVGRVELSLTGRYAAELKSTMLRLARKGCALDVQINFGTCTDPSNYNIYSKKIIVENAFLTDYETEDIGALGSDEQAKVDETVSVSGRVVYELTPTAYASRSGDIITNELVAGVLCDGASCGDCEFESDGCQRFFAVSRAAGGSPSTPADIVFTINGGATMYAHDIDSMDNVDHPNDVNCLGSYVFVVSQDSVSLHYALLSEFNGTTDPDFTEVATGFVTNGGPRAISTTKAKAFIVGASGYIYDTEDVTDGVTVRDAGVLTTSSYNDVHALNDEFAVAVGNAGVIAVTRNGLQWGLAPTSPVGVGVDINTVQVKNENEWHIGASNGRAYYTLNGGDSWTANGFPGAGAGSVLDIAFATDSVVYMAHTTAATVGRILKSTNGGYDWVVEPSTSAVLPDNDRINRVIPCPENPDIVYAVGLGSNGTDGILVIGSD